MSVTPQQYELDLSQDQRLVLRHGLLAWNGPANCTEEFAVAMGFASVSHLYAQADELANSIWAGEPLSRFDWLRAITSTEVVFGCSAVGASQDWTLTTGFSTSETLDYLGAIRDEARRVLGPRAAADLGTPGPSRVPLDCSASVHPTPRRWARDALARVRGGAAVADVDFDELDFPPTSVGSLDWTVRGLAEAVAEIGSPLPLDLHAVFELGTGALPLLSADAFRVRNLEACSRAVPRLYLVDQGALAATVDAPYYEVMYSAIQPEIVGAEGLRTRLASIRFAPSDDYTWWVEYRPKPESRTNR